MAKRKWKIKFIYCLIALLVAGVCFAAPSVLAEDKDGTSFEKMSTYAVGPDSQVIAEPVWLEEYIAMEGEDFPYKVAKEYYLFLQAIQEAKEKRTYAEKVDEYAMAAARGAEAPAALGKDGIFRQNRSKKKKVALTFDDGPYKNWTEKYIKVLEENDVKATFFCLGSLIKAHPEEAKMIVSSGNKLALHSYQHNQLNAKTQAFRENDFAKSLQAVEEVVNVPIVFFRPPYGAYDKDLVALAKENHLITCMWSVDPQDWKQKDSAKVINSIMNVVKDGDIILLHEGKKVTYDALPELIRQLKDKGFEVVTMNELLYEEE